METKHTFSILAYRESPHLQACLDSLKNQTLGSKIILCTSTPNDFLENIANQNGLQLFVNPKREGIAVDWNFALEKATTDYVTLAHQDDIYAPEYAQEMVKAAKSPSDALIVFCNYSELVCRNDQTCLRKNSLNFFIKNTLNRLFFGFHSHLTENKKRLLALGNPIGCPTVTFCKKNLGNFAFDKTFGINMDWKAWTDLAEQPGSFVWVKKTLVSHRIYAGSETSQGLADNRRQQEDAAMFKKFWPAPVATFLSMIYSLSYKNNNN